LSFLHFGDMVKVQGRLLRIELTTSKIQLNKISIFKGLKRRAVLTGSLKRNSMKTFKYRELVVILFWFFSKDPKPRLLWFWRASKTYNRGYNKTKSKNHPTLNRTPNPLMYREWSKFRPFQIWDPWRPIDPGEVENPWGSKPRHFPYVKHSNFFLKCFKVNFSLNESVVGIFQVVEVPDSLESNFHLLEVSPPSYPWNIFSWSRWRIKKYKGKKVAALYVKDKAPRWAFPN